MNLENIADSEPKKMSLEQMFRSYSEYMPILNLTERQMSQLGSLGNREEVQEAAIELADAFEVFKAAEEQRRLAFTKLRERIDKATEAPEWIKHIRNT